MAATQRGDAAAYVALLNDVGPLVLSFLRRRVRSPEDAEDLYQDVFFALHRARHTYEPPRPVEPWLFTIARHVVADHLERRQLRAAREVVVEDPPAPAVEGDGFARRQLEQVLGGMPPSQREALELLKVDGLSVERAAARARTTPAALKVRAHRAYRTLRHLL
ncbi:MAG TPA: sigma-70 family RNA polymerase sigma factor [Candidatus Binatia bacterium]|nr:sigma-70 family RNA polymerase sigma factor [Candidatus Binatia bacterium]